MLLKVWPHIPKPSSKATNHQTLPRMEPDGDQPPIWAPPSDLLVPVRRPLSSLLIPVTLTITFTAILVFFILFFLPPTLSRNSQLPKPNTSVKESSWNGNSISIFLVLFAILSGVFARRNDENSSSDGAVTVPNVYEFENRGRRSFSSADWLESPDPKAYDHKTSDHTNTGGNRLRGSSSSYPDLRQESVWGNDGDKKFMYFDDFEVDFHRPPGNSRRRVRQSHAAWKDIIVAETPIRDIPEDKFEQKPVPPPPTPPISQVPQPPPPQPPPAAKSRRSVRSVPKKYNLERGEPESEFNEKRWPLPPPPPPLPELKFHPLAERREKTQRKKNGATKEIATAIVSRYQSTQKKRKKTKSRDNFEIAAQNPPSQAVLAPPLPPSIPPPPPLPPPSKKVLQNIFKKSSKSKRVHSVPTANTPPPPSPPPPISIFNTIFKTGTKSKRLQSTPASSQPPPPPPPPPLSSIFNSLLKNGTKTRRLIHTEAQSPPSLPPTPRSLPKHSPASAGKPPKPTNSHESVVIELPSPLIPMPPPPPPFKVPEMKFIVKGDFVRIRSTNSSRCSSPGLEDFDVMSVQSDGGDSIGPSISWPIPDVDLKAETFISRRRDEWRLERMRARFG